MFRALVGVVVFALSVSVSAEIRVLHGDWFVAENNYSEVFTFEQRDDSEVNIFGLRCRKGLVFPFFESFVPVGLPGKRGTFGFLIDGRSGGSANYGLIDGSQKKGVVYIDVEPFKGFSDLLKHGHYMIYGFKSDDGLYDHNNGIKVSLDGAYTAFVKLYRKCKP